MAEEGEGQVDAGAESSSSGGKPGGLGGAFSALTGVMKGMGGNIAKSVAGGPIGMAMTAITKMGETIVQVLTKIAQIIIDSSPMLQGVLKIIDKMFKLVMMPVGNMIARILLPMAIKMATKTINLLQKYSNASPDKMMEAASDGFSIMIDSMVEMIGTVLFKVLPPLFMGLAKAIGKALKNALSGKGFNADSAEFFKNPYSTVSDDFKNLMGQSAVGAASAIDQFGLTVITGNKMVGQSAGELATVFYAGSTDISDGFQSTSRVLAIGSTGALNSLQDYNIANAGLVVTIDTTKMKFTELIEVLEKFRTVVDDGNKDDGGGGEGGGGNKKTGWKWWQWGLAALAGPMATAMYSASAKEPIGGKEGGYYVGKPLKMARGGIISRPTYGLIGEAGPEAVIPLNRANNIGGNVHLHFHGDVYGMDDFDRKVEKSVGKYSSRSRGAY